MTSQALDSAVDLVADDVEDLSNPVIYVIAQRADGFEDACNRLSVRTAERLVDGELSFHAADGVMNWVWSYITAALVDGALLPEPALSIYDPIDAGEYHHPGDGAEVDPVERYTMPALRRILAKL